MKRAYKEKSSSNKNKEELPNTFHLPENPKYFTPPEKTPTSTIPMINGEFAYFKKVKIDKISGKLATDLTPPDLIIEKIYPEVHSILHYLSEYPEKDPQYTSWESSVTTWANNQSCPSPRGYCYNQNPPSEYDDIHTGENLPKIEITSPSKDQLIREDILTVKAEASADLEIKQVDFFLNDQLVGSDKTEPYSITFSISPYITISTKQYIKARAYDTALNLKETQIRIRTNF